MNNDFLLSYHGTLWLLVPLSPQAKEWCSEHLAGAVEILFREASARAAQVQAMTEFGRLLGEGDETPSLRAARVLLEFVENR